MASTLLSVRFPTLTQASLHFSHVHPNPRTDDARSVRRKQSPRRKWLRVLLLLSGMSLALALADSGSPCVFLCVIWNDNSSNEDGFQIERAPNGEGFLEIAQVPANVTTYQDSDLRPIFRWCHLGACRFRAVSHE